MGMIAFWATLSLNMPDFTRLVPANASSCSASPRPAERRCPSSPLCRLSSPPAAWSFYGKALWDPVELASNFSSPIVVILGLVIAVLATVSANVAANVVSPSYDFSNALPTWVNFRTGGLLTGVIGILIQPWRLLADPHIYIFGWLGLYGGVLAAVAGVLVAGYWVRDKTVLALPELYRRDGRYWFSTAGT